VAFLGIGRKSSDTPSLYADLKDVEPKQPGPKPAEQPAEPAPRRVTAYERLAQAAACVTNLEERLKDANKAVVDLNARLVTSREARR
jgi:hypothetical protein